MARKWRFKDAGASFKGVPVTFKGSGISFEEAGIKAEPPADLVTDVEAVRLQTHLARWRRTKHPIHLWRAILLCGEHGKIPPEVRRYLVKVAQCLDGAREAGRLRAALPCLGFPKVPRRPLDPGELGDNGKLTALFAWHLRTGASVKEALDKATARLPKRFSDLDERTLKERIAEFAGLTRVPKNVKGWKEGLQELPFLPFVELFLEKKDRKK